MNTRISYDQPGKSQSLRCDLLSDDQCVGNSYAPSCCTYISQYDELYSLRMGRSEKPAQHPEAEPFGSSLHERPPVANAKGMKRKLETELQRLAARPDEDIDLGDIPELDEAFFREAQWRPPIKKPVTIRLDADVLEWFRNQGPGYQTRINRLLRRYMEVQQRRR